MHRYIAVCLCVVSIGFCEASPSDDLSLESEFSENTIAVYDPLESLNRTVFRVNDRLYLFAVEPVAKGLDRIVPTSWRIALMHVYNNLHEPSYMVNNLLQAKPKQAAVSLVRFLVNSVFGLGGLWDVAATEGLKATPEDFGQTLGYWGVAEGPYIVWPLLGPSNVRDSIGMVIDWPLLPLAYTGASYQIPTSTYEALGYEALSMLNNASLHLGEYRSLRRDALDWYGFVKDAYSQKRIKEIDETCPNPLDPRCHAYRCPQCAK